jgi:hypothetical protein
MYHEHNERRDDHAFSHASYRSHANATNQPRRTLE